MRIGIRPRKRSNEGGSDWTESAIRDKTEYWLSAAQASFFYFFAYLHYLYLLLQHIMILVPLLNSPFILRVRATVSLAFVLSAISDSCWPFHVSRLWYCRWFCSSKPNSLPKRWKSRAICPNGYCPWVPWLLLLFLCPFLSQAVDNNKLCLTFFSQKFKGAMNNIETSK